MTTLLWLLELGPKHVEDLIEVEVLMASTKWMMCLRIVVGCSFLLVAQGVVGCLYFLEFPSIAAFVGVML